MPGLGETCVLSTERKCFLFGFHVEYSTPSLFNAYSIFITPWIPARAYNNSQSDRLCFTLCTFRAGTFKDHLYLPLLFFCCIKNIANERYESQQPA